MIIYNYWKINQWIKRVSKIDWTIGHVTISDEKVTLNAYSYKKRNKVFNALNEWIYTKPTSINKIEKQLVVYTEGIKKRLIVYTGQCKINLFLISFTQY